MYNEADIQRHKALAKEYKRLTAKWHDRAQTMFILMLISVVLDLIMIASPVVAWGWVLWMGVIVTVLYLVTHIFCVVKAKTYHAKRIVEESYIATNDYKNINNPHNKENI